MNVKKYITIAKGKLINMTRAGVGQRKLSESLTGIKFMTCPEHRAGALSSELRELMENKVI